MHGIPFAELVVFLENASSEKDSLLSSDSVTLLNRLEHIVVTLDNRIHSIRLKNRLIADLPELLVHSEERDMLLTFQKNIGSALKKACDHDSDAMHLARAAEVVRREMFEKN